MCYYVRCVPCSHKTGIYDKKVDFLDLTLYKIYLLLPTCIGQKSRCSPKCKKIFFFLIRQIFIRVLKKYLHIADWNVRNGYLVRGELWYGLPPPLHPICMTRLLESLALAKLVSFTQFHFWKDVMFHPFLLGHFQGLPWPKIFSNRITRWQRFLISTHPSVPIIPAKWHPAQGSWLKKLMLPSQVNVALQQQHSVENHRKSRIQHCERSELRLHFEWTKVN